ncbi:MAG: hypothetical protein HQ446_06225 [Polaromonas sp.]|nr:hypothetical protein [Polaromonas sp.]
MTNIVTRTGKGSPLEWVELDANFTNLNADKVEQTAAAITGGTVNNTVIGGTTPAAGAFTTLTSTGQTSLGRINISNGGTVTALTRTAGGSGYTVAPAVVISAPTTAGGVQATATCTVTAGVVDTAFIITNAGSGYVEQPAVTFSGGGSGAAAYASVGGGAVIRSLGSTGAQSLDFYTPASITSNIPTLRLRDVANADSFVMIASNTTQAQIVAQGVANANLLLAANGTGSISLQTNGTSQTQQMRVVPTASAVNYIQVTGAATGNQPAITAQGSDANVIMNIATKGSANIIFSANSAEQFRTGTQASAVNSLQANGATTGNSPSLQARGADPNVDLTLTPKGTGRVNITTSIKPKVSSAANVTSPLAWDSTSFDEYAITALANALTINADANASPADGQKMLLRFKDNGTARALTWTTGSTNSFRVVGVTLPTTTVASKLVYIGCIYNVADSRWDAVAVSQEA